MGKFKKILLGIALFVVVVVVAFLVVIGPWPVYKDAHFETAGYYKTALAAIDKDAKLSTLTDSPGPLKAGWGKHSITPPVGTTMAGYGARQGAHSTGVRDELYAKALCLNDGQDSLVIVGSDMLLVPPNVADLARKAVAEKTPLTADNILFTASHTHCGPGGWSPGLAGKLTGSDYDPAIVDFLAQSFASAIIDAYNAMKPAKLATGTVDAAQYIRNRTRKEPVDSELNYMVLEQDGGAKCYVARFSAHPTNFGDEQLEFSAEYPGELQRYIEKATGADAMYVGGSLGSSGPRAPEGPNPSARVEAMGQALGKLLLDSAQNLQFESNVDIASLGIPVQMPSMQIRPVSTSWRLSPLAGVVAGIPNEGWLQAARVGKLMFVGVPFDFSGEVSREWKAWERNRGYDLWTSSFCAGYCGYLSPDKDYMELDDKGGMDYETGLMGWFGPNTEAYFTALFHHAAEDLTPSVQKAALVQ